MSMMRTLPPTTARLIAALALALTAMIGVAGPAAASSLDAFRASGEVVERFDGYVEPSASASGAAKALASKVNAERRKVYDARAKEQNVPADAVGAVYAQQIFDKAPGGWVFLKKSGGYVTK